MKYLTFYIALFIVGAIVSFHYLIPPSLENYKHIVIDCRILDLEGKELRSYQGLDCVFFNDGTFVQTSVSQDELVRIGRNSERIWSLKFPSRIKFLTIDSENNILVAVREKSGNKIIKVSKEGLISSFFELESSRVVSLRQINTDIWLNGKKIAPKNSYLLLNEDKLNQPIVLENNLRRIVFEFNLEKNQFQDLQFATSEELIFFESGPMVLDSIIPLLPARKVGHWSSIKFLNLHNNSEQTFYVFKNNGPVKGSVQFLNKNLFLVTQQLDTFDKIPGRKKVSFFSKAHGVFKRIVVENATGHAWTADLSLFLRFNQRSDKL